MIATITFGVWLISYNVPGYFSQGWMHAKLLLVAILIIYHFYCGHLVKVFRNDQNTRSHVFYRWFNELPVLILLAIVILAVVKPF
jgi:putative membrane protein